MSVKFKTTFLILLFTLCGSFTIWQTIKCLEKYLADPHATQLELKEIYNSILPEISFCLDKMENSFNDSILKECGIDHYLSGPWSSDRCPDPQKLREKLLIKSENVVKSATALSTAKLQSKLLSTKNWKQLRSHCITLDLNVLKTEEKIGYNIVTFKLNVNTTVYFHTQGKFTDTYKGLHLDTKSVIELDFDYEVIQLQNTRTCNATKHYNKDDCVLNEVYRKSMDTLNCTTPFGHIHDQICLDKEKAQKAKAIYTDILVRNNYNCPDPCHTILTHYSILRRQESRSKVSELKINFPLRIKTVTSYPAYSFLSLIAEIGGYVGLFMGVSFLDMVNIVNLWEVSKSSIQQHLFRH